MPERLDDLQAGGSTATFDAIAVAMKMIEEQRAIDPNLKPMIFVLSDGETNRGHSLNDIKEHSAGTWNTNKHNRL